MQGATNNSAPPTVLNIEHEANPSPLTLPSVHPPNDNRKEQTEVGNIGYPADNQQVVAQIFCDTYLGCDSDGDCGPFWDAVQSEEQYVDEDDEEEAGKATEVRTSNSPDGAAPNVSAATVSQENQAEACLWRSFKRKRKTPRKPNKFAVPPKLLCWKGIINVPASWLFRCTTPSPSTSLAWQRQQSNGV